MLRVIYRITLVQSWSHIDSAKTIGRPAKVVAPVALQIDPVLIAVTRPCRNRSPILVEVVTDGTRAIVTNQLVIRPRFSIEERVSNFSGGETTGQENKPYLNP